MSPAQGAPPWRLLGLEHGTPAALLDRGLALLDALDAGAAPMLRWYVPTAPAIVLGRGQRLTGAPGSLPVVSRHSGGGAVLMDAALLSLDVLLPAGHPWLSEDLGEVFLHVGRAWHAALTDLGVAGLDVHQGPSQARRLGDAREQLLAGICFALPGKGEVLHRGRKLVGLAQRRRRHGALVQCGLLRAWRPGLLLEALGAPPEDPDVLAAAVGLDDLMAEPPDNDAVIAAVQQRMRSELPG